MKIALMIAMSIALCTGIAPVYAQQAPPAPVPSLADEVKELSEALIRVNTRLTASEAKVAGLQGLQTTVSAQAARVAALEQFQRSANARFATQKAFGALGAKVADAQRTAVEAKADVATALNALAQYAQGRSVQVTTIQPPATVDASRAGRDAEVARLLRQAAQMMDPQAAAKK